MKKNLIEREEVKQRVLLIDIETSLNIAYTFATKFKKENKDNENEIVDYFQESRLLSFAYQWFEEGKKMDIICLTENDFKGRNTTEKNEKLIKALFEVLNQADIVVAHNGERFDIKKINTYFIEHRLTPPKPVKLFDTCKFARYKFYFNSNSLDDLLKHFGFKGKKMIADKKDLWIKLTLGKANKKDWEVLREYNKQDVEGLRKLYLLFRPYTLRHPPVYISDAGLCPLCGSKKLQKRGWEVTLGGLKRQRYQCQNCGKWLLSQWTIRFADRDNLVK
jgi:hypothetical protein